MISSRAQLGEESNLLNPVTIEIGLYRGSHMRPPHNSREEYPDSSREYGASRDRAVR